MISPHSTYTGVPAKAGFKTKRSADNKMNNFFALGGLLGLAIGLFHSAYLYRVVTATGVTPDSRLQALNFCLWTCALWFLLGGYLLAYTLIALIAYLGFRWTRA